MKIALVNYEFYPEIGGIGSHLTSLCKMLKNSEIELTIFNRSYKNHDIYDILDSRNYKKSDIFRYFLNGKFLKNILYLLYCIMKNISIPLLDRLKMCFYIFTDEDVLIRTVKNSSKLIPFFRKRDFDFILAGSTFSDVLPLCVFFKIITGKKLIALTYGNDFITRPPLYLKTPFFQYTDHIIVASHRIKKFVMNIHNLKEKKISIINLGVIIEDYKLNMTKNELRDELGIPKDKFVIISVGRHVFRKKFDLVLKAIKNLTDKYESLDLRYYLIGKGEETKKLKNLTKKLKIEEKVIFLGEVDDNIRNKYLKASDTFIMPSITAEKTIEGFGIVYLEANYYKLPVIGAKSGGIVDAIKNNETGFLIQPNNLNELVDKIYFLYKHPTKRKLMGEKGHERVIQKFNWNKIKEEYIYLFNQMR
mgnify:CR=1 FL=1